MGNNMDFHSPRLPGYGHSSVPNLPAIETNTELHSQLAPFSVVISQLSCGRLITLGWLQHGRGQALFLPE